MPPKKTVAPSKTHTVIIVLLMWVVALLVFGIGYMVYQNQSDATDGATTSGAETKCDEAVANALAEIDALVCTTTDSYAGGIGPSFTYPIDWEVMSDAIEGRSSTIIRASKDPLWLCDGCDGPANPINIAVLPNDTAATLDTYAAQRYGETNVYGFSDVIKSTVVINGITVFSANGHVDGMSPGPFEELVYVTPSTIIIVSLNNVNNDPDVIAAWDIITSSLDFSEIE